MSPTSFENIIGKQVASLQLLGDRDLFIINFVDGSRVGYSSEGDCCSRSWIEHFEAPDPIYGAFIQSIDEPDLNPWDEHDCGPYDEGRACGHESLAVYHARFRTNRGDIVLEYRNDSNGYYGGWLVDAFELPEPGPWIPPVPELVPSVERKFRD